MPINKDRVLFRDDSFLAVQKLSGELVVKGKGPVGKLPLLDFLKKTEVGLRPLNRLDFETSGVVLFARTKKGFDAALAAMKSGAKPWVKTYRTIVKGRMPRERGEIDFKLPARAGGEKIPASTKFRVLDRFPTVTYVEAQIETGRHHQIRRHLSAIGHPLVLDSVYGDEKFNRAFGRELRFHRFFLHAFSFDFTHPLTGEHLHIEAPLPESFNAVLKRLGGGGR